MQPGGSMPHIRLRIHLSQPCNQITLRIKRELTNARVKKYRKNKCTESQQLNSSMQDDPTEEIQNKQVKENNVERKRAKFRGKKLLNVLKSIHHVVS